MLADGLRPAWAIDLNSGTRSTVTDGRLPINLPSAEMAIYITPRTEIASSSSEWFNLQRGWWQGTADPGTPLPKPDMKLAMDLTDGWAFQPVDAKQSDVSNLVAPTIDDSTWKQMSLGIFTLPDYPDVRHAVIRKHFRVPKSWNHGRTLLRLPGFRNGCQTFLDGQLLKGEPVLAAGSEHILAVDIRSTGILLGATGSGWLTYHPDPIAQQDLSGSWQPSTDTMTWDKAIPLPGLIAQGVKALRQTVTVQPDAAGKTVVLHGMEQSGELKGIVINGHFLKPNARESSELNLNVTQWVHPGPNNEIILLMGGSHETITRIALEFHKKGSYP